MQTTIATFLKHKPTVQDAEEILRKCVHCGFCSATCPSYQVLGDELDSPRGRIYLIKQMLEGEEVSRTTLKHLDQCLTCHNCETTCPSGVKYGQLIDIGRSELKQLVARPLGDTIQRKVLLGLMLSPAFGPLMRLGQSVREWLPVGVRAKVPARRSIGTIPESMHARRVLLPKGCVQPAMMPSIDSATTRVLDALKISVQSDAESICCGAVPFHLDEQERALALMRQNIDRWLPLLVSGQVEAIVSTASGCGAMIKGYAEHLKHDPNYADKARQLVSYVKDVIELVYPEREELKRLLDGFVWQRVVFHPPCTLQHWQKLRVMSEQLLSEIGFDLVPFNESHLCCGSAGTYSVLQADISKQLRDRKLQTILEHEPSMIVSSNMGCINHLTNTSTVTLHWIEAVDQALSAQNK